MRRLNVVVGRPLFHRRRVRSHRKFQPARLIPNLNGFHERAGREHTMAFRADSAADHLSLDWISNASPEHPFSRWGNLREGDYLLPDFLRRRLDINRGAHNIDGRRSRSNMFAPFETWDKKQECSKEC